MEIYRNSASQDGLSSTGINQNALARPIVSVPALAPQDVHVWYLDIASNPPPIESLARLLSSDELGHAARFVFPKDHARYLSARGTLRLLLAGYQGCHPNQLVFGYGEYGKPHLLPVGASRIEFNVSHSDTMVVFAFARDFLVGVDIEAIRNDMAVESVARYAMQPVEVTHWQALAGHRRVQGFFHWWTRKEACLKAIGKGLATPMSKFCVSANPDAPTPILHIDRTDGDTADWSLSEFSPAPGYTGALVTSGHPRQVFHWSGIVEDLPNCDLAGNCLSVRVI